MPDLRHGGFFHRDSSQEGHPVDLLREALGRCAQEALFSEALLVLPEAFNVIDGYYQTCNLDADIEAQLRLMSQELGLCFVVGLIGSRHRHSETLLIDANIREVLSRKTRPDGSPCYEAFTQPPRDELLPYRNLWIGSLVCMDAAEGGNKEDREKQEIRHAMMARQLGHQNGVLCVPARFGSSSPTEVAKAWNRRNTSVIVANWGTFVFPSVLHLRNGQTCVAPTDGKSHVHFAPLM